MSQEPRLRPVPILPALVLTLTIALPAAARTSIGFTDPHDLQALLDYRLPTWSYRTWTLAGDLSGGGWDYTGADSRDIANRFRSDLASTLVWNRESERTSGALNASVGGRYAHAHAGDAVSDSSHRQLAGSVHLDGTVRRYLRPGGWFVGATATGDRTYSDDLADANGSESAVYLRGLRYGLTADVGVGRVRNVTPLVRARRLSERLATLGRPRLTPGQERQVAAVLAREPGYLAVYDRPERRFWRDVLQPILGEGAPLTPYEILYLRDVLVEVDPARYEGASIGITPGVQGSRTSGSYGASAVDGPSVGANAAWYHNFSLDHQVRATLSGSYRWFRRAGGDWSEGRASLFVSHLWVVADRSALSTGIDLVRTCSEVADAVTRRAFQFRIDSSLRTWLEDKLALVSGVTLSNDQRTYDAAGATSRGWQWSYRLGVEYALDRLLW